MFRLLRYFSIASLISITLAAIVIGVLQLSLAKNHLLEFGESRNVTLAQTFSTGIWPLFRGFANDAQLLDANALRRHPDNAELGQSVLDQVCNTPTVRVNIFLLDGRTLYSTDAALIGTNHGDKAGFLSAKIGLALSDISHYDKYNSLDGELVNRDILSSYIPLRTNADAPIDGVMEIDTDITDLVASDNKQKNLLTFSLIAVLATLYAMLFFFVKHADKALKKQFEQQRQIEQNLRHAATHDPLTNLPNRLLLLDRIKQSLSAAERHNNLLAVALIDIDDFQSINNALGQHIGDTVLQTVAQRLTNSLRVNDTIARLGGDEFVVSLPDINSNLNLFQIAQKMLGTMALPITVEGHELHLTASIGIALYPEHGKDAETLIRNADMAMRSAKRLGRNRHQMYTEQMSEQVQQQVQMDDEMWRAYENNEFVLHYQPIIDLKSGSIVGAEALLRWPNAHGTWHSPAELIPMSEQCGLIVPLSEWILSEACSQLQAWQEGGSELNELTMAVNLSPRYFATAGLATMIAGLVEQAEINPGRMSLEIADGLLTEMNETILSNFEGIKRIGIKFSLDDFGSGYSSLGHLRSFPIDTLKIAPSFIKDLHDNADNLAIVTTIISLANSLNLLVVAKGIETNAQLTALQELGCQLGQGYLFSHPLPAKEFLSLVLGQRDMRNKP